MLTNEEIKELYDKIEILEEAEKKDLKIALDNALSTAEIVIANLNWCVKRLKGI